MQAVGMQTAEMMQIAVMRRRRALRRKFIEVVTLWTTVRCPPATLTAASKRGAMPMKGRLKPYATVRATSIGARIVT